MLTAGLQQLVGVEAHHEPADVEQEVPWTVTRIDRPTSSMMIEPSSTKSTRSMKAV
jgi:hypothetical protein